MTTFKIRVVSGGIERQTFVEEFESLDQLAAELNAKIVESRPGWAFAHYGPLSSAEITYAS